jgi:hypothetical protein
MKSGASNIGQQLEELNKRRHDEAVRLKQAELQERVKIENQIKAAEDAEIRQREEKRLRLKEITAEDRKLKDLQQQRE